MHLKLPVLILIAIVGISIVGGLVVGGLVLGVSFLKEKWEPRIEYLGDYLPVDPDKTEFTFGGGGYPNERCTYHYLIYTSWTAYRFQVVVENFSGDLHILDGDKRVGAAPYVFQEGNLPEERCIWLSFTVIMPNQIGTYELELRIRLFGLLFSREYKWMYTLTVETFIPKPPPEAHLTITLDKETYRQGEKMDITLTNISNETVWFTDTAYNLFFEKFNGVDWEFHTSIIGGLAMTPLEPGETAQLTWTLDVPLQPFPPGQYRVGAHGVYAEFEVIKVQLDETELEIVTEFLKTTDVADCLWEDTVRIIEAYDDELCGKVLVVNHTTANGGHPNFMLEAIEHHTAIITLNMRGEVVSAFCVWGSFHDDKVWDLVNQRWVEGDCENNRKGYTQGLSAHPTLTTKTNKTNHI